MRILIICGFVGVGKTTLLLQMARYLSDYQDAGAGEFRRVMILKDEILGKRIDDRVLRSSGFAAEATAGEDITASAVQAFQNFQTEEENGRAVPEWLIIELCGLTDPAVLKERLIEVTDTVPLVVDVVDISRWKQFLVPSKGLLKKQVENADIVLLNKIDLASFQTVEAVAEDIQVYHEDARCFPVSALHAIDPDVWRQVKEAGQ